MRYRDYDLEITGMYNLFLPVFSKRLSFRHEAELRCATPGPDTHSQRGMTLVVDLEILVEKVVVSPPIRTLDL